MGYLIDGRLVITGRSKDLIIFNGRNIWPQDLEWAIERLEGCARAMSPRSRSPRRTIENGSW